MRVPLSWLVDVVPELAGQAASHAADLLTDAGVEVEEILSTGTSMDHLVIGEVLDIEELTGFKKPIRYCQVRVDDADQPDAVRGIVCGAQNFAVGDHVVVALPGAVLPGDFRIATRSTYGHTSDGMICSARELGLGDEHDGILVLSPTAPVGANAVSTLGLDDVVLVTEPTPDRGYQLSVRGLGRELAAALDVPYTDPAAVEVTEPIAGGFPVRIEDPDGCTRFTARILRGFDPSAPTPEWLATRLRQTGFRPISLAVDVTNYLTVATGQPMHAYDLHKLSGGIVVRRARAGESIITLDDVVRPLTEGEELLITDDERIHGLAGVMGAEYGEITSETVDILLEAAHFDATVTSRTVRRHGLLSEAGRRFERGVDPELGPVAVELATELLTRYGGAIADPEVTSMGTPKTPAAVSLSAASIRAKVGVDYPNERIVELLEAVGGTVLGTGDLLVVTPPTWRPDLVEMVDYAEEVARIDGYANIPSVLPAAPAGHGLNAAQRRRRQVAAALGWAGFVETPSPSFHDITALDALRVPIDDARRGLVPMANPLSVQQSHLRSTLLPGLLGVLVRNVSRGFEDLSLCEFGTVFREPRLGVARPAAPVIDIATVPTAEEFAGLEAALPIEEQHVAVALAGRVEPAGWWGAGREAGWSDTVAAARLVAQAAGTDVHVRSAQLAPWHPGRCAAVVLTGGRVVGYAGELHPAVCDTLGLPARTSVAELDLGAIIAAASDERTAPRISTFPPAVQDIALVVANEVPAADVEAALRQGGGELVEDIRLFDVYAGAQVGAGRKSLAYRLRFRAPDRTLTVAEATAAREAAVAATADLGAVLRG